MHWHDYEPRTWRGLFHFLFDEQLRLQIRTALWQSDCLPLERFESVQWSLADAEMNVAFELDQAVEHWLVQSQWPALTEPQKMFLAVRLEMAAQLVHELSGSPVAIPLDDAELLRWLLVTWWERRGVSNAARSWLLNKWDEAHPDKDEESPVD